MQDREGIIHGCCRWNSGISRYLFWICCIIHSTLFSQQNDPCHFDYGYWSACQPMPGARTAMDVEVSLGRIYAIGGMAGTDDPEQLREELWIYDPVDERWDTTCSPLPAPRAFYGDHTCVLGNRLYVIGGTITEMDEPVYSARVEVYDPVSDSWQRRADLPVPLGGTGVCTLNGQIYVCGGVGQNHLPKKSLYRYDPGADTWYREPDMLSPRFMHIAATVDGKLYAIGGISDPDACAGVKLAEVYDPTIPGWSSISPVPTQICKMASAVIDHDIYLLGGKVTMKAGILNTVIKYHVSTDSWSIVDEIPGQLCLAAACTTGRSIYLMGGTSLREPGIDRVWRYDLSKVVLEIQIPDMLLDQDSLKIDLSRYFSHASGGKIEYAVCACSDPTIVSTWIYDSLLIIKGIENGEVHLRILAESGGYRAGDCFSVTNLCTSNPEYLRQPATFAAFPNPVYENLYLEAWNTGAYRVTIRTIEGRLILTERISDPLFTLDLSCMPAGIYLIHAWNGFFETTEKLIKY